MKKIRKLLEEQRKDLLDLEETFDADALFRIIERLSFFEKLPNYVATKKLARSLLNLQCEGEHFGAWDTQQQDNHTLNREYAITHSLKWVELRLKKLKQNK